MKLPLRCRPLPYLIVALLLLLALVETWALVRRPGAIDANVGGADAALLAGGFHTKELAPDENPFRWTQDRAQIVLPWTQPAYRLILGVQTAVTATHRLDLAGCGAPLLTVEVQPGWHYYHLAWVPQCQRTWPGEFGAADLFLLAEARPLAAGEERRLGLSVGELYVRGLGPGPFSPAPLLVVLVVVAALALLLYPWDGRRLLVLAGLAAGLPPLLDLLAWHPPGGLGYNWLPVAWLPGLLAVALVGLVLVRLARSGRRGALLAALLVGLLFLGLLLNLHARWAVDGPDYGWHLNHGGSWERVLRAHAFYPFGLPLVLWLGQLWGGQDLVLGRTVCLLATLVTGAATAALAWRLLGRESAWLGLLLGLASPMLVAYGVLASTDAPLMALATLALLVLCWSARLRFGQVGLAGLLLGLAYLFRHQALLMAAAPLFWLLFVRLEQEELPRRLRGLGRLGRLLPPLLLGGGFLLGSAPQWVLDIRDAGRPFFSRQYLNIWYFAYQRFSLPADVDNELWYVLSHDPPMLWRNWLANLEYSLGPTLNGLLIWPVGLLAVVGLALAALNGPDRRGRLLVLWTVGYLLVVTLTMNKERFFLPIVPVLVVLAALLLHRVRERLTAAGPGWALLYPALVVGLWCLIWLRLLAAEAELALYTLAPAPFP